ncbi:MAG TPA: cardiolipin synthase [Polyangiaceae bacterium]|jgi:cardiolipin synthase|nr:cardiolipin synthase [Polyangiaceae bacterium]
MSWHELLPRATHVLRLFLTAVGLALVPLVLVRRKEPASTIAWILTLVFLPALGAILFLMFGRDRVRWPAKRKRELDRIVLAQLAAARPTDQHARESALPLATPLERALFRVGEHLSHFRATGGNKVDVLVEGEETYEAIGAAIDAARHHVHAQYYLIRNDATGRWFRDRLAAAAKRGVVVRLLMDGYGCLALGRSWRRPLLQAGARVADFLPMRSVLLQPVNLRNHRKIVVVDGETAFTGGFNVGDEYKAGMPGVGAWRDVHLRIAGNAAAELQRVFFQDWAFATREPIDASAYFPKDSPKRGDAIVAIVPSGPDTRTEAIHRLFFGAIVGGEHEVAITTPYFVPDEAILVAMELAAMRGVDLKLVLPSRSNHRVTFHAGRSFYTQLLEAGVDIREYEPGIVHAKTLIADSAVALVGSANMDLRSFRLNFEVHALVHDRGVAARLRETFQADISQSRRVDLAEWQARPWGARIKEGASRLVSPLL